MKKLYLVEITVMVMAEDRDEAANIAAREARECDCESHVASSCPSEWYDAVPFGSEDGATCGAVLKQLRVRLQKGLDFFVGSKE